MEKAIVDIIMPVYNKPELTRSCLESIEARSDKRYNVIFIDNASDGDTEKFLDGYRDGHKNVFIIRNAENLGWVKAVNQGMKASTAPYICLMNNDTIVRTDGWLSKMIDVAQMAGDIGMVNPMFDLKKDISASGPFIEVDFCRGYCMLIKRQVLEKIGFLDQDYGLGYYDDDDYSVRAIRAGFRCVRANDVFVEHLKDSTFKSVFEEDERLKLHEKNKALFYSKWGKRLKVAFVVTKDVDGQTLERLLFKLARRQHIVYVWKAGRLSGLKHINIRQASLPRFFKKSYLDLVLSLNNMKKKEKQYNIIFTDNPAVGSGLFSKDKRACYVNMAKDEDVIESAVDALAKA